MSTFSPGSLSGLSQDSDSGSGYSGDDKRWSAGRPRTRCRWDILRNFVDPIDIIVMEYLVVHPCSSHGLFEWVSLWWTFTHRPRIPSFVGELFGNHPRITCFQVSELLFNLSADCRSWFYCGKPNSTPLTIDNCCILLLVLLMKMVVLCGFCWSCYYCYSLKHTPSSYISMIRVPWCSSPYSHGVSYWSMAKSWEISLRKNSMAHFFGPTIEN